MAEGEYDWFFDTLIQYIKGPRWRVPVLSFIEENCIVFDSSEENALEFQSIHKEFCKIVDDLLCDLMVELGIDQETFMAACGNCTTDVHKKVVHQILSVDDFLIFKSIMVKKNQQLENAAMQMVMTKESNRQQQQQDEYDDEDDEDLRQQMQIAMKLSETHEQQNQVQVQEDDQEELLRQMQLAIKLSEESAKNSEELQRMEDERMMAQAMEASKQEERRRQTELKDQQLAMIRQQNEIKKQEVQQIIQKQVIEEKKQQIEIEEIKKEEVILEKEVAKIQKELQEIQSSQDARTKAKEEEKLRQLAELRRQQKEAKNKPKEAQAAPVKKEAPVQIKQDLPSVQNRQGGFFENEQLKNQQKKLLNDLKSSEGEVSSFDDVYKKPADPNAGLSFAEALRKKREALELDIAAKKKNGEQTQQLSEAEQRKNRLTAQRDALVKKRNAEREQELKQHYKENPGIMQSTFYKKMMQMDNDIKQKEGKNVSNTSNTQANHSQAASETVIQKQAEEQKQQNIQGAYASNGFLSNIKAVNIN